MLAQWTYTSRLTPQELSEKLVKHYDDQPTFRLISRLSEAGVVVRSIHPPEGAQKAFFGHKTDTGFSLVQNRGKTNLTPYQPILRIAIHDWGQGSKVDIILKPHKNAKPLVGVFVVFGLILLGLGVLNIAVNSFLAICSCLFGVCFVLIPKYRANFGFNRSLHESKIAWEELPLKLEFWPNPNEKL